VIAFGVLNVMEFRIMSVDNLTFLSIDTETTGLSPINDRIIQIGFSMFVRGICVETSTFDIYTDVPNSGYAVNRISPERIANGHPISDICALLWRMFQKHPSRYCIYNSPFDLAFLGATFAREGFDWDFRKLTILDPLVIWRKFHPFKRGTLSYVSSYYGIPYNDEHDAGPDSAAAGHVYCQMYSQHGILRNTYSNQMLNGWYNRWAGSFVTYLKSHEIEYDLADFAWPCREEYLCSQTSSANDVLF
jgi:DNA polymerase III subunit epsilon